MNDCSVGAFECWTAFYSLVGLTPCISLGDLTDEGFPVSCECDVNGAISMAILRAASLYESSCFLADLTIRNPENDNSELLWHCGPFPYSLKDPASPAALVTGMGQYQLKQGQLTLARFDEVDGRYALFGGEGKTTTGPKSSGTYVWLEVDNWKRWEEKLIFGPYIHHIGGIYGNYLKVLREVARYLGIYFDNAHEQGIYSL
jgi:L-fucose isomerase-like protein